jgi:DNA-directed RNA polymerase subunit beta
LTDGKLPIRLDENEGVFTIPEFGKIQFEGFCHFIDQGLMEELHNFPKIEDIDKEIESRLFGNEYELAEPFIKERDVVYQSLTYYSELYVPARSIQRNSSKIQKQNVFLGNIPLMNSHGMFVVNGIYIIMVNQILISPGIYYHSELDHNRINYIYTGTLISNWGRRSKLEIDVGERIWARVRRKRKIYIPVLLSSMGLNLEKILDNTRYPEFFFFLLKKKKGRWEREEYIWSKEKAILEFYKKLYCVSGDLVFSESLCKELQEFFFRQRCELGKIGQ